MYCLFAFRAVALSKTHGTFSRLNLYIYLFVRSEQIKPSGSENKSGKHDNLEEKNYEQSIHIFFFKPRNC